MKRSIAGVGSALILSTSLLSALFIADSAAAQTYRRGRTVYGMGRSQDFDRDGIPNYRDRDIDNDGIRNSLDSNDYSRRYRSRVRGSRYSYRNDWDRDGIPNNRDRHPRNRRRR